MLVVDVVEIVKVLVGAAKNVRTEARIGKDVTVVQERRLLALLCFGAARSFSACLGLWFWFRRLCHSLCRASDGEHSPYCRHRLPVELVHSLDHGGKPSK